MNRDTDAKISVLLEELSDEMLIEAIGISNNSLLMSKEAAEDFDVFIYCNKIPTLNSRKRFVQRIEDIVDNAEYKVSEKGHWGTVDLLIIDGVEIWLMYFTIDKTINEIEKILLGQYLDKQDNYYYPIGRCAMFSQMNIVYDKEDFLKLIKNRLEPYSSELSSKIIEFHLEKLEYLEDLKRAVKRQEPLFYHFALETALDHFLQVLFAANHIYFPSRKNTLYYISKFKYKPQQCEEILLRVIRFGGFPEGLEESFSLWSKLIDELRDYCTKPKYM